MPYLDESEPSTPNAKTWRLVFKNALLRRASAEQMTNVFSDLVSRYPVTSDEVAKTLFSFRARAFTGSDDQLLFAYGRSLLVMGAVSMTSVLAELLRTSQFADQSVGSKGNCGLPTCEERFFTMLAQMFASDVLTLRPAGTYDMVFVLTTWLRIVSRNETKKQLEAMTLTPIDHFTFGMYEALATLVITIFSSKPVLEASKKPWWKQRRPVIVEEVLNFANNVLLYMQSQFAARLQQLTAMPQFMQTDDKGRPLFTNEQIMASMSELPVQNTRAGLFVWLNACLRGRPLTDDMSMLTYLQMRYPGNNQNLIVDLLIASFDVLTNVLLRKESDHQIHLTKSFICNKLPHLLSITATFLTAAVAVESCIEMAFMAIRMDALPPISAGANEVRERLKVTRLEFLQACALHGLLTENTISSILQEPPISLPRITKYTREGLAAKCHNNVGRLEPLMGELDGMLGNSGAIATCIVDMIGSLCANKDTMSLKALCNMVTKKIAVLDIIMQYTQPANLLQPLCLQLNNWTHDQDRTEFTPAYEEFAAVLLFVLATVHRYDLQPNELGIPSGDNFVARLLQDIAVSKSPGDLSEEQSKQLGKWIEGLYATDETGETGGISDEVMRNCPPQAFYQLVPTLFDQTVLARKSSALTVKTFNGGLELLVEPFLLPSLIGGLSWLVQHSWADHNDAAILLQILDKLLKPSSSSQETKAMHRTILGIVADPLHQSLQILNQRSPEKKQVGPLLNILKPFLNQQQTMEASKVEMDEWLSSSNNHITERIRTTIQELVTWVTEVGPSPPPKYSHKLFAYACATVGAEAVRDAIVTELKGQTAIGNGSQAIDICCAMISSPFVSPGRPAVRDAFRLQALDVQQLLHMPSGDAESVVRLNRRVEAQLTVSNMAQIPMAVPAISEQAADQVMAELGLTDGALATDVPNVSVDPSAALATTTDADFNNADLAALDQVMSNTNIPTADIANLQAGGAPLQGQDANDIFGDLNMDMTQASQQMLNPDGSNVDMGNLDGQQNNEEDIFAGLDMGDFNFD
jgi:mediator of RNA polymerase II transcription subunit 5